MQGGHKINLKRFTFIFTILALLLCCTSAFCENTPDSIEEVKTEEKAPPRYYKHVARFGDVAGEKINTDRSKYIFYYGSDNMSTDMHAEVMPINATDKKLSFSSSDESIVTVTPDGILTAAGKTGTATIYISSSELYKEVNVEVRKAVTGITLSQSDVSLYADRGESTVLSANIIPADATNKNITWKSSDTSVAGVDENGKVSLCGVGTAEITVQTEDGGFKAKCLVRSRVYNITVKGVFINNPVESIPVGTDYALTASVYPESALDRGIYWESSAPDIISVDSAGRLHAQAEGYAYITAKSANGVEDYFTLSAVVPDEGVPFEYISTARPTAERIAELSVPARYSKYSSSYNSAVHAQLKQSPVVFTTNARNASQSEVEQYLNPANQANGAAKYQFLDLSHVSNVSASMLNVYLSNKGILKNHGEHFRNAAEENHVNAAYLAIHACLESGGGTSELACGVDYNGVKVYNMFGIGAYDADPIQGGAKYAYEHGWTDVETAIFGGAKWISENYINNGQNTLYKMRWNPEKPGTHQYATDVAWAAKQASTLRTFMEVFPIAELPFDVPVYSGSNETPLRYE